MSTVTRPPSPLPDTTWQRRRWSASPPPTAPTPRDFRRRRLTLVAALLAVVIAAGAVAFALTRSGEPPPATGAAALVPADALAYVNLSTDPARPAVERARSLAARFPDWPLLAAASLGRLSAIVGGSSPVDYSTDVRPWLGKEAAFAMLPTARPSAQSLLVLDVAEPARAQAFLARHGAAPAAVYDGVRVLAYPSGSELAFLGHYLAAGPDAAVRAAIDASRGRAPSLAHDPIYERAAAGEPADRVLDAYLPAAGVRRLLAARAGILGAIGLMLDRPAVEGTAVSLSVIPGGARVLLHSALDAGAIRASGARATSFAPTLQSVLPAGSTLMLDVHGLGRAAPGLLRAAAAAGIAGNVGPLLGRLGQALASEGVNLQRVVSIFGGETAVALSPGPAGGRAGGGVGGTPSFLIVARVSNEAAARSELASLEVPVTALFSPASSGGGQIPMLADQQVGGVTVHELHLAPGLQLDYAVFDRLAVVSTSVDAIDGVARRSRTLADEPAYQAVLSDQPQQLSSLVFGDFSQLLPLGEQTGLTSGARIRELLGDLAKVRAIGLSSTSGENDTTTELSLEIP
jgi:Protein of unknown function (DUF3352)